MRVEFYRPYRTFYYMRGKNNPKYRSKTPWKNAATTIRLTYVISRRQSDANLTKRVLT